MSTNLTREYEHSMCFSKNINDLPDEIISYILEFLPYAYLQDARSVCRRWYGASQSPSLLNQEEVICYQSMQGPSPDFLLGSKRTYWNLCFKGDFDSNDRYEKIYWSDWSKLYNQNFWLCFGPQLRSLSFQSCEIDKGTFLQILSHCPELKSLKIIECQLQSSTNDSTNIDDECTPKLSRLEMLAIDDSPGEYYDYKGKLFDSILSCTKNMKSLSLVNCMNESGLFGTTFLTPKHVLQYVKENAESIVNVAFIHKVHSNETALIDLLKIPNLRLQSLETNYPISEELACNLKSLKVLKLRIFTQNSPVESLFVEFQNLKRLEIDYYNNATLSNLHLLKNLTCLVLGISFSTLVDPDWVILKALCSEENRILKRLSLRNYGTTVLKAGTVVAIARTHPALVDFELDWNYVESSDLAIQGIFKYQEHLRSLRLTNLRDLTNAGLSGEKLECVPNLDESSTQYSLSRLKRLYKLDLEMYGRKYEVDMSGISFENVILPQLGDLSLSNCCQPPDALESFLKNHPNIESLSLHSIRCREETVDLIVTLPRLRYIYIEPIDGISEDSVTKLRRRCRTVFGPCTKIK